MMNLAARGLDDCRKKPSLQVFYKTINQDTPICLQDIVPNRNAQNHYQLTNEINYPNPRVKTPVLKFISVKIC